MATGVVVPEFVVLTMGYRQGWPLPVLMQLPPGAAMVTSGPRLEKPTLVPTWRSAATETTPGQLPGRPTAWPSELPAATTMVAPAVVTWLMASR